jgi:hypothetical protein
MNAPLRRCVGFLCSRAHEQSWNPCAQPALPRDRFCLSHREGLNGALLGLASFQRFQGFTHVTLSQPTSKIIGDRKSGRRYATIDGERALREGIPHLEIMLREILAASEVVPGEIAEIAAKDEKEAGAGNEASLENGVPVWRRRGKARPPQAHETRRRHAPSRLRRTQTCPHLPRPGR